MTTYIAQKLAHLRLEILKLHALAEEIALKDEPTATDRRLFDEYLELVEEILDYAARLQRPGEKWRIGTTVQKGWRANAI